MPEEKEKEKRKIKNLSERHSPPPRKTILTKTYNTPETVLPIQVVKLDRR